MYPAHLCKSIQLIPAVKTSSRSIPEAAVIKPILMDDLESLALIDWINNLALKFSETTNNKTYKVLTATIPIKHFRSLLFINPNVKNDVAHILIKLFDLTRPWLNQKFDHVQISLEFRVELAQSPLKKLRDTTDQNLYLTAI